MTLDVKVGRGSDTVLLVLTVSVARLNRSHVSEEAVDVVRTLTVEQASTLLDVVKVGAVVSNQP